MTEDEKERESVYDRQTDRELLGLLRIIVDLYKKFFFCTSN